MFSWFSSRRPHPVAGAYLAGRKQSRPSRKAAASSLRFVVLDAETSGFDAENDRILSLAAVEIQGERMSMSALRSWFVFQSRACVNPAITIHGITPADTARGEPEEKVMDEFLQYIQSAVLVGHHISFDVAMINKALKRHFGIQLHNPVIDTAVLAMRELEAYRKTGYANQRPPSLEEICTHCGVPMLERHTAEGDAFTTGELFLLLGARRRKRLGRSLEWRDLPWSRP